MAEQKTSNGVKQRVIQDDLLQQIVSGRLVLGEKVVTGGSCRADAAVQPRAVLRDRQRQLCALSVLMALPAEEAVRRIIASARNGATLAGKNYKLQIETVDDQMKPLRFS